jgi:tetratricopeptide (TPR) repeat protein
MEQDFNPFYEDPEEQERLNRLETMLAEKAYFYFDVSEWEDMIQHYLQEQQFTKARKALVIARQQHPISRELNLCEADLCLDTHRYKDAIAIIKKLERENPGDADIHRAMGTAFSRSGRTLEAIASFRKALELHHEDISEIYFQLSCEYSVLGKQATATYWVQKILDADPENIGALYDLGMRYDAEGRFEDAHKYFKDFTEENPYNHDAWYHLGNACMNLDKYEEACSAFEYAIVCFEEFSAAWYGKGEALLRMGNHEKALEAFNTSLEIEGPSANLHFEIGQCYEFMNDFHKSLHHYNKALEIEPDYEEALLGKAWCYYEMQLFQSAKETLEKTLVMYGQNAEAWLMKAEVCRKTGEIAQVDESFENALLYDPENWEIYLDYSDYLFKDGNHEGAIFMLERGILQSGNDTDLAYRAGAYAYLCGKSESAFNYWLVALSENPSKAAEVFEYAPNLAADPRILNFFADFGYEL